MTMCAKCGRRVIVSASNCDKNMDGEYVHVKCPSEKKPNKDLMDQSLYRQLMDRVKYHQINNASGYVLTSGVNYKAVANKVKALKNEGYSYEDQLYALDEVVELQNGFCGYGAVVNNIIRIIANRDKKQEQIGKIENKDDSTEIKFDFDLSSVDDYEW